jgi:hypothetical protein
MKAFLPALLLALVCASAQAEDPTPELTTILKRAAAIRPHDHDLVWRQIPWYTDPTDALKQARAESRPLFVWLAGGRDRDGSPLERC